MGFSSALTRQPQPPPRNPVPGRRPSSTSGAQAAKLRNAPGKLALRHPAPAPGTFPRCSSASSVPTSQSRSPPVLLGDQGSGSPAADSPQEPDHVSLKNVTRTGHLETEGMQQECQNTRQGPEGFQPAESSGLGHGGGASVPVPERRAPAPGARQSPLG